jgi:two-component system alkaline phosphatase synthesis response regulator PhoP
MGEKKAFRVLVVDDDKDILDLLEYNLKVEGFKVLGIDNSSVAVACANDFLPDLIILDIMMPHPNGIEICRELRASDKFSNTYIFFLTAKSESYYQEAALDTGGDDFIEKIVGLRALTYKIKSVLKKSFVIRRGVQEMVVGNVLINRKARSASINGLEIVLSKPEFELLFFFAQNPDKVITLKNLLHNIWGSETFLYDSSIEAYINNLCKRIGTKLIHKLGNDRYMLHVGRKQA